MESASHVFNERLKRIEPVSKVCSFCMGGVTDKMNDNYFFPIFKEKDRTNIVVYRSVKYAKINIGVPRCASCKTIHENAKKKALPLAILASLAILAFTVYHFLDFNAIVSVILFFASALVGFGGYVWLLNMFTRNAGIDTLKRGAEGDPLVQDFLMNGWSLKQPSA